MSRPTATDIRRCFDYDPRTGEFTHRLNNTRVKMGQPAGTPNHRKGTSYLCLSVGTQKVYAHRAAWLHVYGEVDDALVIDHIDGDGLNNRIGNLRLVTRALNQRNRRDHRDGSLRGVWPHRGGFSVYVGNNYVGWSKDFFEACCKRRSAEVSGQFLRATV